MKYLFVLIAFFYYNMSTAQQEFDSITTTQNLIYPYHEIYSTPYSPQMTLFPLHGTITWEGTANTIGVVGQNILYYQPDTDFIGMDSLEIGYWKSSNFGPVFTKRLLYISVVPACSRTLTLAQNNIIEDDNVYSVPYRPQFTILPNHGTVSWLEGTGTIGVIGDNSFFYEPDLDFLGQDTLEIGYWAENQFGTVFTKCTYFIEVLPASNSVKGNVIFDANVNCLGQGLEEGLENWLIRVVNNEDILYTTTDENGFFTMSLIDGDYTISAISPNQTWGLCENDFDISLVGGTIEIVNFAAQAVALSPFLEVSISTGNLTPCESSFYQVNYCNNGTSTVEDAYIEVRLDPFLEFNSASANFTNLLGDVYTFPLGNLAADSCGSFQIYFTVSCESEEGQSHCTEAQIFPIEYFDWDGPILEVTSRCEGDSVYFFIKNKSTTAMPDASGFIVIEDQVVYLQGDFTLGGGDSLVISQATTGRTFRLETFQPSGFPYTSFPSASIEACYNDDVNEISRGFISQYPEDDFEPFIAIDCRESLPALEPNALMAFPKGYGESHYITRATEIEYVLTFQNTGTDTVQQVILKDFISPDLDLTTIQFGASSHPYQFSVKTPNVIEFTFDDINLSPQSINEMASHGFLTFKISQQAFNPLNTLISNHAAVSFDGAPNLLLNPVFHRVQEKFIRTTKPLPANPKKDRLGFFQSKTHNVYPNPASEFVFIEVFSSKEALKTIDVFDVHGQRVATYLMPNSPFAISTSAFQKGIYFYCIKMEEEEIRGKFVLR